LPSEESHVSKGLARETAAVADAMNPTSVMPIWIVASRREGSSVSVMAALAPAEPASAACLRAARRAEMSAISAPGVKERDVAGRTP